LREIDLYVYFTSICKVTELSIRPGKPGSKGINIKTLNFSLFLKAFSIRLLMCNAIL